LICKRVGSSKSTSRRSVEKVDDLHITTFFNEDIVNMEKKKGEINDDKQNKSDFPIFDAVPK
jgi:hypothetical protein